MQKPPDELDGARVVHYVILRAGQRSTGRVRHFINGQPMQPAAALAIARYAGDESAYLFFCDSNWQVIQDDLLSSIEEALAEIKRQYENIADSDIIAV